MAGKIVDGGAAQISETTRPTSRTCCGDVAYEVVFRLASLPGAGGTVCGRHGITEARRSRKDCAWNYGSLPSCTTHVHWTTLPPRCLPTSIDRHYELPHGSIDLRIWWELATRAHHAAKWIKSAVLRVCLVPKDRVVRRSVELPTSYESAMMSQSKVQGKVPVSLLRGNTKQIRTPFDCTHHVPLGERAWCPSLGPM